MSSVVQRSNQAGQTSNVLQYILASGSVSDQDFPTARQSSLVRARRERGTYLATPSPDPYRPAFLMTGWAIRLEDLPDGRRQIFGFVLPGDPVHPFHCLARFKGYSVMAATDVEIIATPAVQGAYSDDQFTLTSTASLRLARLHLEYLHNHVLRLSSQNAFKRIAHLMVELHERLQAVGLTRTNTFHFPLPQNMLGEALGMSTVHVNRTLRQLRAANLLQMDGRHCTLLNRDALVEISDYVSPLQ